MGEHRTLGQILMSFGRVTEPDVERALEHQREHGGYFGEALLALGYVTPEELEWALAAQFDLPYVFPEAENVDREAASLVTPEWALTHLTLPIMKTKDTLSVVVDSPIKTEAVDQLQARTDLRIELALAPPDRIRELIRQLFGRDDTGEDERRAVASLRDVFNSALELGSRRFGLSVRGAWAHGWYEERGTMHRKALDGKWQAQLSELVSPEPSEQVAGTERAEWLAHLALETVLVPVEVRYLASPGGSEFVFTLVQERSQLYERFSPPTSGIVSEVRLLAQTGAARFAVTADPAAVLDEMLPYLPALLFDSSWRSVHVTQAGDGTTADDVFTVSVGAGGTTLDELRAFRFDAATVDLDGPAASWARAACDVAGVVFIRWDHVDAAAAVEAGITWELRIASPAPGRVDWSLHPLKT